MAATEFGRKVFDFGMAAASTDEHGARRTPCPQVRANLCAWEGWHVTAVQHFCRWASSQVLEYVQEAFAEETGASRRVAPPQVSDLDWAPPPGWGDRIKAVEDAQARLTSQLSTNALRAVLATPLPTQEALVALEEDVFVFPMSVGGRKLHVRVSVH